ncbi:MAG TPA: GNAT family N-acetyltransferase [Acidimicrobiia bacterium]
MADRSDLLRVVAEWHWNEWGDVDPAVSLRSWTIRLADNTNHDRTPTSYVAIVKGDPVGSVVLVDHDMPDRQDLARLSPWLAGLFVLPGYRRAGIGSRLIKHAEAEATRFGANQLNAYTSTASDLYKRLGWEAILEIEYEGSDVTVFFKPLDAKH